jgi:hypothetical protein
VKRYKKKASNDAYGYTPQPGSQAEMIERCLSRAEWKSAKEITQCVNGKNLMVGIGRVRQHLNHHVTTHRLDKQES